MMVIIDLYLACTALVLMLIEDAPLQNEGLFDETEDHPPLDSTPAERADSQS